MRFITEFEVPESAQSHMERRNYIPEKRHLMEVGMGNMIAKSFGWQNPVNHNLDHHRSSDVDLIVQYLEELESFGKPAGEAKELNNDTH